MMIRPTDTVHPLRKNDLSQKVFKKPASQPYFSGSLHRKPRQTAAVLATLMALAGSAKAQTSTPAVPAKSTVAGAPTAAIPQAAPAAAGEIPPLPEFKVSNKYPYIRREYTPQQIELAKKLATLHHQVTHAPQQTDPGDILEQLNQIHHGRLDIQGHTDNMLVNDRPLLQYYLETLATTAKIARQKPRHPQSQALLKETANRLRALFQDKEHPLWTDVYPDRKQAGLILKGLVPDLTPEETVLALRWSISHNNFDKEAELYEIFDPGLEKTSLWLLDRFTKISALPPEELAGGIQNLGENTIQNRLILELTGKILDLKSKTLSPAVNQGADKAVNAWVSALETELKAGQLPQANTRLNKLLALSTQYKPLGALLHQKLPRVNAAFGEILAPDNPRLERTTPNIKERHGHLLDLWQTLRDHTAFETALFPARSSIIQTLRRDLDTRVKTPDDLTAFVEVTNRMKGEFPVILSHGTAQKLEGFLQEEAANPEKRLALYGLMQQVPIPIAPEAFKHPAPDQATQGDAVERLYLKEILRADPQDRALTSHLVREMLTRHVVRHMDDALGYVKSLGTSLDNAITGQAPTTSLVADLITAPLRLRLDPTRPLTRDTLLNTLDRAFPSASFKTDPALAQADVQALKTGVINLAHAGEEMGRRFLTIAAPIRSDFPGEGEREFMRRRLQQALELDENHPLIKPQQNTIRSTEYRNFAKSLLEPSKQLKARYTRWMQSPGSSRWLTLVAKPEQRPAEALDLLRTREFMDRELGHKPGFNEVRLTLDQHLQSAQLHLMNEALPVKPVLNDDTLLAGYWHQVPAQEAIGPMVLTRDEFTGLLKAQGWEDADMPAALEALRLDNINPPPIRDAEEGRLYNIRRDDRIRELQEQFKQEPPHVRAELVRERLREEGMAFPYDPTVITHRIVPDYGRILTELIQYTKNVRKALEAGDRKAVKRAVDRETSRHRELLLFYPDLRLDLDDAASFERFKKAFPKVRNAQLQAEALARQDDLYRKSVVSAFTGDVDAMLNAYRMTLNKPNQPPDAGFVTSIPQRVVGRAKWVAHAFGPLDLLGLDPHAIARKAQDEARKRIPPAQPEAEQQQSQ